MASAQDIRDLVSSYIARKISASDFANRFSPVLRAAIKSRDKSVKELALAVHAQISHHFNGFIPEEEFRSNLEPIGESAKQGVVSFSYQIVRTEKFVSMPAPSNPGYAAVIDPQLQLV